MMHLKMTADSLRLLVRSVADNHYVTTPADLEKMKSLHQEGVLKELGEIALALFYQLQAPGTGPDGIDPIEQSRRAMVRIKEIFGLNSDTPPKPRRPVFDFSGNRIIRPDDDTTQDNQAPEEKPTPEVRPTPKPNPHPNISEEEWEARERPRQLLENILSRQVDICEEERTLLLRESVKGPSPYERAAEIAPNHPEARLMRQMQDSNLREVRRLTNLLLKIKRYKSRKEGCEKEMSKGERV
jgi:hypothetical protein